MLSEPIEPWDFAARAAVCRPGDWRLDPAEAGFDSAPAALGWALASYRFDRYRKRDARLRRLAVDEQARAAAPRPSAEAVCLARDLINTPASDLGPAELADAAQSGRRTCFGASFRTIVGDELLAENYPAIHAVGRASPRAPRLIDLTWGDADAPQA